METSLLIVASLSLGSYSTDRVHNWSPSDTVGFFKNAGVDHLSAETVVSKRLTPMDLFRNGGTTKQALEGLQVQEGDGQSEVLSAIQGLRSKLNNDGDFMEWHVANADLFDLWMAPLMLHAPRVTSVWTYYYVDNIASTSANTGTGIPFYATNGKGFWSSLVFFPYYTAFNLATKLHDANTAPLDSCSCAMLYIWSLAGAIVHPAVYLSSYAKHRSFSQLIRIALGEILIELLIVVLCSWQWYSGWPLLTFNIPAAWFASLLLPPFAPVVLGKALTIDAGKDLETDGGLPRGSVLQTTKPILRFISTLSSYYSAGFAAGIAFWILAAEMVLEPGQSTSAFLLRYNLLVLLLAPALAVVRRVWMPSADELVAAIPDGKARRAVESAISDMRAGATRIVLSGANVGDDGAKALAAVLPHSTVTYFKLEAANIGDEGANALALALPKGNPTSLSLVGNRIGNKGAKALAAALLIGNLNDDMGIRGGSDGGGVAGGDGAGGDGGGGGGGGAGADAAGAHANTDVADDDIDEVLDQGYGTTVRAAFIAADKHGNAAHALINPTGRDLHRHGVNFWASVNLEGKFAGACYDVCWCICYVLHACMLLLHAKNTRALPKGPIAH
jgi:hypothetical protein